MVGESTSIIFLGSLLRAASKITRWSPWKEKVRHEVVLLVYKEAKATIKIKKTAALLLQKNQQGNFNINDFRPVKRQNDNCSNLHQQYEYIFFFLVIRVSLEHYKLHDFGQEKKKVVSWAIDKRHTHKLCPKFYTLFFVITNERDETFF